VTEPLVLAAPEGTITVAPVALERVVVRAAQLVQGARVRRPKRSVEVLHGAGRVAVVLELAVEHGVPVPAVAFAVQERVAEAVAATSGLEVERVDLCVEEIG
jgi:Asp23 family, cell envelope-related function